MKTATSRRLVSRLTVVGVILGWAAWVTCAWADADPETAANLVQTLVQREELLQNLHGYVLDCVWVTPWYASVHGPQTQVIVTGAATAGGPPPPAEEDRFYGAYFGQFALAPQYCRFDMAVLKTGEENLWKAASAQISFSGNFGGGGDQPGQEKPPALPDRFVLLRQDGRLKTQRAAGLVTMRMEITQPTPDLAIQQQPLAGLLFSSAQPTLAQSLQAAYEAAEAPGGANRALAYAVTLEGPTERDGQEQYQLTWKAPAGNSWDEWRLWLCPAWGYAPTELTQLGQPQPGDGLPPGTQKYARRWRFEDYRQLADNLWLPAQVTFYEFLYSPATPDQHTPLARVHELRLYELVANTNPEKLPVPPVTHRRYADALAALVGYYPDLADQQDWLQEIMDQAKDVQQPEPPQDLLELRF